MNMKHVETEKDKTDMESLDEKKAEHPQTRVCPHNLFRNVLLLIVIDALLDSRAFFLRLNYLLSTSRNDVRTAIQQEK